MEHQGKVDEFVNRKQKEGFPRRENREEVPASLEMTGAIGER